jgi:hypothetical protein
MQPTTAVVIGAPITQAHTASRPLRPVVERAGKPRRPRFDNGNCLLHTTNTEVLQFEVVINAVLRAFSAQAAFFHTTKWRYFC